MSENAHIEKYAPVCLNPTYQTGLRHYSFHPFFFNDTATTEIYTLSLHDALPILLGDARRPGLVVHRGAAGLAACRGAGGQAQDDDVVRRPELDGEAEAADVGGELAQEIGRAHV